VSFADELRAARNASGMSQSALAEAVGVSSFKVVSQWENGHTTPNYDNLERLESVLGVRLNVEAGDEPVTPRDVPEAPAEESPFKAKDAPPKPRKGPAKKAGAPAGMPSLRVQLEMPYRLGATALATRLPYTSGMLNQQAGPCAEAWDVFLMRYPKLREKIESGAVAADIVNLVMAHVPILQVAREEIAAQQAAAAQQFPERPAA
jgi:transcriptional regulator with XRE-family HTH domain